MKVSAGQMFNLYFALWGIVMPVTSFLVLPSIQGTTPADLLAFGSILIGTSVALFNRQYTDKLTRYALAVALLLLIPATLSAFGQIGLTLTRTDLTPLNLINPEEKRVVLRSALFTQTLYFAACALTFSYVRYFFRPELLRWVFAGAWLLVIYGFYDWLFFAIFKTSGDFLVNRTFGEIEHTGSWTQTIHIAGVTLMRFKSCTGEPSMFALVALPYFLLALHEGRKVLSTALLCALVLSTSTSAYVGLVASAAFVSFITRSIRWQVAALIAASIALAVMLLVFFPDTFAELFVRKMSGEDQSGQKRLEAVITFLRFLKRENFMNLLFGIGFGYVHDPVMISTILNSGLLGYAIFAFGFLYPVFMLPSDSHSVGLRSAVFSIFLLYNVSVAELFYPTSWMFLGLAYWKLDQLRKREVSPVRASVKTALPRVKVSTLLLLLLLSLPASRIVADQQSSDRVALPRFGVATHFAQGWNPELLMPAVRKAGLGWIRDGVRWADIEKEKGNYQLPPETDRWIRVAREAGLHVILVLNHGNPIYQDRFDADAYGRAAAWLARSVAGRIDAIEILNEPHNFDFRKYYGGRWNGWEIEQKLSPWVPRYVALLNKAADAIKAANPEMKVIGFGSPPPVIFRELELGVHSSIDGIVFHPYSRDQPEFIPYPDTPRTRWRDGIATADGEGSFVSQIGMLRARARQFGVHDELWLTEWGHSTYKNTRADNPFHSVSERQQASYITRRMVETLGLDVRVSIIYDLRDDCPNTSKPVCNYGLLTVAGKPKLAYFAVQRVCEALRNAAPSTGGALEVQVKQPSSAPTVPIKSYLFETPGKQFTFAFWAVQSHPTQLTADISMTASAANTIVNVTPADDVLTGDSPRQPNHPAETAQSCLLRNVPLTDYPTFLSIRLSNG